MRTYLTPLALLIAVATPAAAADEPPPGRDDYQFEGVSVVGTEWKGELGRHGPFTVRFEKGGVVCYTLLGSTIRDMTWKQEGGSITFAPGNKYSEFRVVVRGDRLVGEGLSQAGEVWKLDMKRVPTPKKIERDNILPREQ
jgi:hypothetical protein